MISVRALTRASASSGVLSGEKDTRSVPSSSPLGRPVAAKTWLGLPRWQAAVPFDFDALTRFYRDHGAGLYARYRAFLWEDGALVPVAEPDCSRPEELLGYELQRGQVEANTRQLVQGREANNVLLFGDGGTGKSATVKSMLYLPGMEDLRLIEIQKENLTGLPSLMRSLGGRRHKFILFIDDFLANGNAAKGCMDLIVQAGAELVGMGFIIEKSFQPGGKRLREKGVKVESLAIIESLDIWGCQYLKVVAHKPEKPTKKPRAK